MKRNDNLEGAEIGAALRLALATGIIREEDTAVIFYDLRFLEERIRYLGACFPPGTLHAFAIKANPLRRIMDFVRQANPGSGVEAASLGEVTMALKAGYPPANIVFDSPVKTAGEIEFALRTGINLNIDNLSELARVARLIVKPTGSVGLRINPQVGLGTITGSSVAGEYSKFGVPLKSRRDALEEAFTTCPWLNGVHLHVGSQGCHVGMLTEGIGILYDFVLEMNEKRGRAGIPPISVFDTGGGLPVSYHQGSCPPSMEAYAAAIAERAPLLFDPGHFRLITEFGRWIYTNSGWTVSRVEYVKQDPGIKTAMLHTGADLFVRECLNPNDWSHEYSVFDRTGNLKTGVDDLPYNLAGPLCFSGDILARKVSLPQVEEGDFLVIHDTGGYTFSMWSRYNSRQTPRIAAYHDHQFEIIRERESLEELHAFWQ